MTVTFDAETDAAQVLAQTAPARELPIDPVRIARTVGIQVFVADLPEHESGLLRSEPGVDPVMYLNRADSRNRQRFTCAHEIGHYVKRVNAGDDKFTFSDKRDTLSSQGTDPDEIYANQFAAALLMPADLVRKLYGETPNAALLAVKFDVSSQAMTWRLRNLGLLAA